MHRTIEAARGSPRTLILTTVSSALSTSPAPTGLNTDEMYMGVERQIIVDNAAIEKTNAEKA